MSQITGVMKMHVKDKWSFFFVPWMVLLISFAVNLFICVLTGAKEPIYTGGISSIYVYMLVIGIIILVQTFPFALGMGVRRTDFFLGTVGMVISVSAGVAIVLFLLSLIEQWTGAWGVKLHFFHLPYLNDGSAIEQILTSFILILNMFFVGFTISSVNKRFGRSGMLIFFVALFLIISVGVLLCTYYQWWLGIFHWFGNHTAFTLAMWTVPLVAFYMLISYLLLRKATV